MQSETTASDQPMTKKGTPVKLKKDGTPSMAGRWKRDLSDKGSTKKSKAPGKKKQADRCGLFLYWKIKKDDMFQEVETVDAEADVHDLFIQNPKVEEIYLMQPVKLYHRPTLSITDL